MLDKGSSSLFFEKFNIVEAKYEKLKLEWLFIINGNNRGREILPRLQGFNKQRKPGKNWFPAQEKLFPPWKTSLEK